MYKVKDILKFFWIILLQVSCLTFAEAHDIVCRDSHGKLIPTDTYLSPWETYSFSLDDNSHVNWKIYLMMKWDNMIEVKSAQDTASINTDIDEISFKWYNSKRFYTPTMDTCCYKSLIVSEDNGKKDSLYVKLAYVPVKPIVKKISLTYDGYNYEYHCLNDPLFSCVLYIPNAELVHILYTEFFPEKIEEDLFFIFDQMLDLKPQDGHFHITNNICDTNQFISFYGVNKYGWSINSDTILINDLIEDPEILKDLSDAAGINAPVESLDDMVDVNSNEITVKSSSCDRILVYDLQGRLAYSKTKPVYGYKIYLKKGTYVIKIHTKNKYITKKVLL